MSKDANKNVKAGIWIRVSTEEQAKGESPENHLSRAMYYAKSSQWNVVETYDLAGVSGRSVLDHPETKRMLSDVQSGKIQALIFSKLSRLARNTRELLFIADTFKAAGANLVSLDEKIDTSSAAGMLLFTVVAALAEWERVEISSRVAAGVPGRARDGKPTGGLGPYGYLWVPTQPSLEHPEKRLFPHPDEALVVKRAFELFLETKKIRQTALRLEREGFKTRKGSWQARTVKRMLCNPVYAGRKIANYLRRSPDGRKIVKKPENEWVTTDVDPIVPLEVWNEVQNIFALRPIKYQKRVPKEGRYLFSGLLDCDCGTRLYVIPYRGMQSPRYVCRSCGNRISEDDILSCFLSVLREMTLHPEMVQSETPVAEEITAMEKRISVLKKEQAKNQRYIDKAFEQYADGQINKSVFSERHDPLRQRKEAIGEELPRLQSAIDVFRVEEIARGHLLHQARTFAQMWDILSEAERGLLIKEIMAGAVVGRTDIKIRFFSLSEFMLPCNEGQTGRASLPSTPTARGAGRNASSPGTPATAAPGPMRTGSTIRASSGP